MMNNNQSLKDIIEEQKCFKEGSLSYHAWVSKMHKYLYIGTPKVACTKVKVLLHQLEGYSVPDDKTHIHNRDIYDQPFVSELTSFSTDEGVNIILSSDWFRFCFVRNPYDRLFSAYKSKIMNEHPQYNGIREDIRYLFRYPTRIDNHLARVNFRDFVRYIKEIPDDERDYHWRTQTDVLLFDSIPYDFIGRFETFQNDLSSVLHRLNAPNNLLNDVKLKVNATDRIFLAAAYDRDIANIVYEIYQTDFDAFGYDRNSWMIL